MANVKVSELPETTNFYNDDYMMVIQSNQNKKISKENMLNNLAILPKILWSNPNPTSEISSIQTITLSSDDYDVLELFYLQVTSRDLCYSSRFLKGNSTRMRIHTADGTNIYRELTYNNNTSYTIQLPYSDTTIANINSLAIPTYIVGYKTGIFNN